MIHDVLTATGAVWWACMAAILAALLIGRLGAFWREWRTPRCRWCEAPVPPERIRVIGADGQMHDVRMCYGCIGDWLGRHHRLPREVQG